MSNLYIVATPIGNLEDVTKRALRILSEVDLILCEDTRTAKKLLDFYRIKTPVINYHQHSKFRKINHIIDLLKKGKNLALISEAGTPGIADPGSKLVKEVYGSLGNSVKIVPIPGASAAAAAASVSGFPMDRFIFLGFPPAKKKRKKFFADTISRLADLKCPAILYESPHRIIKTLEEIRLAAESRDTEIELVVCRELTKKFETIFRGKIKDVSGKIDQIKGEFVVVIRKV